MSNWKPISENPKENGRYLVTVQGEEDKYVTTAEFEFCEVRNGQINVNKAGAFCPCHFFTPPFPACFHRTLSSGRSQRRA